MNQDIETLDDLLKSIEEENYSAIETAEVKPKAKRSRGKQDSQLLSQKGEKEKVQKVSLAANSVMALNRSANSTLNAYINKAPQYKVIKQQIEVLKEKAIEYKRAGNLEASQECSDQIKALSETKRKFERIVKSKTKEDRDEQNEKIANSDKLKELKAELKELKAEYINTNPNTLYERIRKMREKLSVKEKLVGSPDTEIINLDDDELDDNELDNIIDKELESSRLANDYHELCAHIGSLIGFDGQEIEEMKSSDILKALKDYMPEDKKNKLAEVKTRMELNKMEASSEMKRLKGYNDVTDIMFDIFDFSVEEKAPKEMLAASNVGYVEAIAYNTCSKMNMLHHFADCISYGLLGLTVAINKWYNIQKMKNHALSFEGFAHMYVVNAIQRGLYELTSGGMISGSARATIEHYRNKNYQFWLNNNDELKDLPKDMIEDLLSGVIESGPGEVMSESSYKSMVGGDGADDADIWANAVAETSVHEDTIAESKLEYENLINSLKQLFNLFETKVDKKTGIKEITDKKLFDKYDYKLFLMSFGLLTRYNPETGKNEPYSQEEIAEQLQKLYKADGVNKTFSQPAIAARKKSILDRIAKAMEDNPGLKKGFEYLTYYFIANRENMNLLSNSREELGIKYDLEEEVKDENSKFAEAVRNGKKLSDVYEITDGNLLDEEIARGFRDLRTI